MTRWLLHPRRRWLRVVQLSLGIGFIVGGFELVQIVSLLKLDLEPSQVAALGGVSMLCGAAVAVCAAIPVGLLVQWRMKASMDSRVYAAGMAGTAFLVSGFFLWHAASDMFSQGRGALAIGAMAFCPVGVAGVTWFNAGYWARREELGAENRLGWTGMAFLFGWVLVGVSAGIASSQEYGGRQALEGDPNVLLVTVDTLRRDHVGVYGDRAATPNLDALGADGIVFMDAVTPTPETAPSHASMMTSLHPLRHEVLSNAGTLKPGYTTLGERLEDEGYATAAFVSSFAVNQRTGLDAGFQVYDDDFAPVRGLTQILVVQYGLSALMVSGRPHLAPWLLERDGDDTVRLATDFIAERGDKPWFIWVHLFEPHAPYEAPDQTVDHRALLSDPDHAYSDAEAAELQRLYAAEVSDADRIIGELLETIDVENTLVVVTSDHGEQLGEHDIWFQHHGLYEDSVRIPLIIRAPGLRVYDKAPPQQVRVMDIAPAVLRYIKLDPMEPTEGVDLFGYAQVTRKRSLVTDLVGRESSGLEGGCLMGLRAPSKVAPREGEEQPTEDAEGRVKYIVRVDDGYEEFYDLVLDPTEELNVVGAQAQAAESAMSRLRPSMERACGVSSVSRSTEEALKALGYIE